MKTAARIADSFRQASVAGRRGAALSLVMVVLTLWLAGCGQPDGERPATIAWDRDTCEYCRMTISDRAFAAQAWVGAQHRHFVFDDVGCLVNWLHTNGVAASETRLWVADYRQRDQVRWLDATSARYVAGQTTPMDYGFGATDAAVADALDFESASQRMLERNQERQR